LEGEQISPIEILPGEKVSIGENIDKMWVNVGSVGQPRDGDNRSSFMVWDTELKAIEYHRVEYPFKQTMSKIRKVPELDNYLSERLEKGL
jgi:diadenosine tetraphosphatase ApaH/serine/threonine PP2A family protein phosphatase